MKTENLLKAYDTCVQFQKQLRAAHTDAIEGEDDFAEVVIFNLLEDLVKPDSQMRRIVEASQA